ncbi:MAG: hypothetical protein HN712_04405 [Gemmatimonadetes bacterium]|jgi:hypothetical protein|nr:hypothetical protein [Gemmatimonadota bacterium]MBT6149279.1 hypothetical protein [Gemmatimonadota bacterium]MBT7859526.1 hypothetical protein [Gemmatimonadota bacterium]
MKRIKVLIFVVIWAIGWVLAKSIVGDSPEPEGQPQTEETHSQAPESPRAHLETAAGELYPLGFSRSGAFAYLRQYDIGGPCGFCPRYDLVILSTVTDEILYRQSFDALTEADSGEAALSIDDFWHLERETLQGQLTSHEIATDSPVTFGPLPFAADGRTYQIKVHADTTTLAWSPYEAPISLDVEAIVSVRIEATASNMGRKLIHRWNRPPDGRIVTGLSLVASVRSPFEPRAAIILERQYKGAEEEAFEVYVVGMHLTRGFK